MSFCAPEVSTRKSHYDHNFPSKESRETSEAPFKTFDLLPSWHLQQAAAAEEASEGRAMLLIVQ
jgi:hypothetical protein